MQRCSGPHQRQQNKLVLAEQDQALSPGRASFAAPCKGKHSPGRVLSPQAPSTQLRAGVGQGADPPSTPPCCSRLAGVGCRGSGGSCASKQSHGVDEIPLLTTPGSQGGRRGTLPSSRPCCRQLPAMWRPGAAGRDLASQGAGVTGSWCHRQSHSCRSKASSGEGPEFCHLFPFSI